MVKKNRIFKINIGSKRNINLFVPLLWLVPLQFVLIYSISLMQWEINSKQWIFTRLNKKRRKVQGKNVSCERGLNFDQRKTISKNYKPIRVRLWLVYEFTDKNCRWGLFSEFIQAQKRYPTSLNKISFLT